MSILEHIGELRSRLVKCAVASVVTTAVAFTPGLRPVLSFVTRSYCDLPAHLRTATAAGDATCGLAALSPLKPLSIRIRVPFTSAYCDWTPMCQHAGQTHAAGDARAWACG
jgi:Sec-independent protein secretion pathway component TatC